MRPVETRRQRRSMQVAGVLLLGLGLGISRTTASPADASTTAQLDPLVVTGTRTAQRLSTSPVPVTVVSAAQIARSGARDLTELLEREGAVHVTRAAGRGSTIEMQGLASEHVLILVNGRRIGGRVNGAVDLSRLRVADIERVEIVKGASSALYGSDALGGVVNIITRRQGQGGQLTVRGADGQQDVQAHRGLHLIDWQLDMAAGLVHQDSYDLNPNAAGDDGPDLNGSFASLSGRGPLGRTGVLDIDIAWQRDESLRFDAGTGGARFDTQKRIDEVRLGIAPQLDLAGGELRLDAHYHRYHDQFLQQQRGVSEPALDEETLDEIIGGGAQYDRMLGAHTLTAGVEYHHEHLQSDRLSTTAQRDRQSVYLQDQWTLADGRFQVVPGLRLDRDSQFGQQLSPKLALRWQPHDRWQVRASYGEGFRAPDFKQLLLRFNNGAAGYRVEGNPDLRPERTAGGNLDLTVQWAPALQVHVSGFVQQVEDLIDLALVSRRGPALYSYRNVRRAALSGIGGNLEWHARDSLDFRLGYRYLHSRDRDRDEPLSGRAPHQAHAAVYYHQPRFALGLRGNWVGTRVFTVDTANGPPTAGGRAAPYALFDVRAEWRGRPSTALAVGVKNLFDEGDPAFLPIPPQTLYVEIQRSL